MIVHFPKCAKNGASGGSAWVVCLSFQNHCALAEGYFLQRAERKMRALPIGRHVGTDLSR